jgi:hypothetical protein
MLTNGLIQLKGLQAAWSKPAAKKTIDMKRKLTILI